MPVVRIAPRRRTASERLREPSGEGRRPGKSDHARDVADGSVALKQARDHLGPHFG